MKLAINFEAPPIFNIQFLKRSCLFMLIRKYYRLALLKLLSTFTFSVTYYLHENWQ